MLFPPNFVWGTATSAYQVEGGIHNQFSAAGLDAGEAVQHWQRYSQDYAAAQDLGCNAFRLSLEWARLEPEKDQWNESALAQYGQMIRTLRERGLRPCVTLWHFTHPHWFELRGGWENPNNLNFFLRYVEKVVQALPEVDWWSTLNEPLVFAFQAYENRTWPPFGQSRRRAFDVAIHLLKAHIEAYQLIHRIQAQTQVGLVMNMTVMDPLHSWDPRCQLMSRLQSWLFNEMYWHALTKGALSLRLPGLPRIQLSDLPSSLDFMGINYYTRYKVGPQGQLSIHQQSVHSDLGWEIYPEGLGRVLAVAAPYALALGIPIFITENGVADIQDIQRKAFLRDHLQAVLNAIQLGIPIHGYFYWSLIDNFEWAEGDEPAFGLLDRQRNWRPSAYFFKEIVKKNGF